MTRVSSSHTIHAYGDVEMTTGVAALPGRVWIDIIDPKEHHTTTLTLFADEQSLLNLQRVVHEALASLPASAASAAGPY